MSSKTNKATPIRAALMPDSRLLPLVESGLGAVENAHHKYIDESLRQAFGDSLALDDAMLAGHEQENRWDYLLGHSASDSIVGLEPHSARQDEITTVIKKREAALVQLRGDMSPGRIVSKWYWVASGDVHFAHTERAKLRLDQSGIEFVGKRLLPRDLPASLAAGPKKR